MTELPPSAPGPDDPAPRRAWPTGESFREAAGWLLLLGAIVGVLLLGMAPTPYAIQQPGSVFDTLGEVPIGEGESQPLIEVEGAETYEAPGRLDLVTVSVLGAPGNPTSWIDLVGAWFQPGATIVPAESLYPAGQSQEEADEEGALQMQNSQQEAVAAALAELGIAYGAEVVVSSVLEGAPAEGLLEAGDVVLSIDGEPVTSSSAVRSLLGAHGTDSPAVIVVDRDGAEQRLEVTPVLSPQTGLPVVGVLISSSYDFPIEVDIQLEHVGGPSAGLMFALGVYEMLTPGALAGGAHVAGTGTIEASGSVGAIGGLRQKLHAAAAAGADWFLLPAANCDQLAGAAPEGLRTVAVASLGEAVAALEAIAAGAQESPGACPVG